MRIIEILTGFMKRKKVCRKCKNLGYTRPKVRGVVLYSKPVIKCDCGCQEKTMEDFRKMNPAFFV
ncbi:hypothetical protein P4H71_28365 [Paenibacillus kribbensis]|uniref:hypothetical protein n=1 Tax=Paenibacillus kribbensis TaxID=172713 RepID=UPI002DB6F4AD|nr:hypothetical protein [Paenibacillus kribbensis]MEC0238233.1 hypothetical protein [Paenibacillus kribbensis]